MSKTIVVIGAGFSGLSAASYLAKEGYDVHVFETLPPEEELENLR
ncbi:MAG: FAD-dependent oxidoreductase [Flavobacteriales bacterium]